MSEPRRSPGRPFRKGQSGNPSGKPKGAKHRATQLAEALMEAGINDVVKTVIDSAKAGDMRACALILERLVPIRRGRPVEIELPRIENPDDAMMAQGAVIAAMASGELSPEEAELVAGVVDAKRKAIETLVLENRIAALEARQRERP